MFIHRIQTFQIGLQIFQDLYIYFITVFADNLLRLFCKIRYIHLWITGISHNRISTYSHSIKITALFIKSHIHFICHHKITGMFPDFFIQFPVHRMPHQDHDQAYHGFTARKTSYNRQNCPDSHPCTIDRPCYEKNEKRKRK